jgi:hypothetical protein
VLGIAKCLTSDSNPSPELLEQTSGEVPLENSGKVRLTKGS